MNTPVFHLPADYPCLLGSDPDNREESTDAPAGAEATAAASQLSAGWCETSPIPIQSAPARIEL